MKLIALIAILLICFCLAVIQGSAADTSKENHYDVWKVPNGKGGRDGE